jgi:site-specific DNA-methyltransferase (adenine-specific)
VTSPPYDNLRDYKGYVFDFETIAKELYRVTKEGGVVVWVIGDSVKKGNESGTSFKQALFFKNIGFNLHDTMIYRKNRGMMFGSLQAYKQNFEYMFVFVKGKIKTFNLIRDNIITYTKMSKNTSRNKDGSKKYLPNKTLDKNGLRENIWSYSTGTPHSTKDKIAYKHPAIFPEKLAQDHIVSWSNKGDLILDCFAGSGTTLKMAKQLNRNFIGIEIEKDYVDIAERRLCQNILSEVSADSSQP